MREDGVIEAELPVECTRVGIHEELRVVPSSALLRIPGTVDTESVGSSWRDPRDMAVEDAEGLLGKSDALLATCVVEQAQVHSRRTRCPEGDVGARRVEGETEGIPGSCSVDRRLHVPLSSSTLSRARLSRGEPRPRY